jgi:ABC-2 type transport system ATP-binding protein
MTATEILPTHSPPPINPAATDDAVVVDRMSKRFGNRVAVDKVSFSVPVGTVAGLIGPNGAGKTTIMAMLLGLVRPTSGSATVLGSPVSRRTEYLPRVGSLIEGPAFHPGVSGINNLRSLAVLGGHRTDGIDELIDLVGLTGRGGDRVGSYSFGMKQRLGIAAALIGDPELVILDEPTNGLDPVGMKDVRTLIREMSDGGRTVIVSSHLLGELEHVCDWLIVLDRGGLVHLGTPESLGGGADTLVLRTAASAQLDDLAVIAGSSGLPVTRRDDDLVVTIGDDVDAAGLAAEINRRAHTAGIVLAELHHDRADLEVRYLELVNRHVIQGGMS